LLLIAGLASDSQTWQLVLNGLRARFKVIIFDNRGSGRTKDAGAPIDIDLMAKDAVMLLDHLGIEDADILGHSMGGYIAQEMAITYPKRVKKLILVSTSTHTSERNKVLFQDLIKMYDNAPSYEDFLKEFMVWILTPEYFSDKRKTEKFIDYVLNYPYRQSSDDFKRQVNAYTGYSSLGRVNKILAETLVVTGGKDILITPEEANLLASSIQIATLKKIPNAAHSIQVEAPDEFVDAVCAF